MYKQKNLTQQNANQCRSYFAAAKVFHQVIWERMKYNAPCHFAPIMVTDRTIWNCFMYEVLKCSHYFCDVIHAWKQTRKQTLKSAQYGLEIFLKTELLHTSKQTWWSFLDKWSLLNTQHNRESCFLIITLYVRAPSVQLDWFFDACGVPFYVAVPTGEEKGSLTWGRLGTRSTLLLFRACVLPTSKNRPEGTCMHCIP